MFFKHALAQFIQTMVGTGVLIPDEELESYIREVGNLPVKIESERIIDSDRERRQTDNLESLSNTVHPEDNQDIADDAAKIEEAKKRLGRS